MSPLFGDTDPSFKHPDGRPRNIQPTDEGEGIRTRTQVQPGTPAENLDKMYRERGITTEIDGDAKPKSGGVIGWFIRKLSERNNPFKPE